MYSTWEELEEACKNCRKCKLCNNRNNVVVGTGNRNAELMFIGEGPRSGRGQRRHSFCWKSREVNEYGIRRNWDKSRRSVYS